MQTMGQVFGLLGDDPAGWLARRRDRAIAARGIDRAMVERLIADRCEARRAKDFAKSGRPFGLSFSSWGLKCWMARLGRTGRLSGPKGLNQAVQLLWPTKVQLLWHPQGAPTRGAYECWTSDARRPFSAWLQFPPRDKAAAESGSRRRPPSSPRCGFWPRTFLRAGDRPRGAMP